MAGKSAPDGRYPQIGVSIVAYRPEAKTLHHLLAALAGQVGAVFLVDNGEAATRLDAIDGGLGALDGGVVVIDAGGNLGVAAGHNLALTRIFGAGCSHALLFDQDSLPQGDMIGELLRVEAGLIADARPVGVVGPQLVLDDDGRPAGFIRFAGLRPHVGFGAEAGLPVPARGCDVLITSGTLMRREVFDRVGPFAEDLFIDYVDIEWCFRAASLGYDCYGAVDARMRHALGDDAITLPFSGRRRLVIHNPLRIFYIMRNRVLLYRMPHVPRAWKLADFPRMVVKIMLFGLLVAPRRRYLRAALAGIGDGLKGLCGAARKPF